jgi:dTDP-4-amino-4,6-dideoxygalactose transaminase
MLDVTRENSRLAAELDAALAAVSRSGAFVHGPACHKFEAEMANYCGAAHAVGCASGSDALLLALLALGVGPGDEVIVPSFTFFATASAVWRLGAKPVFADIAPDSFNLDPADVLYKITTNTKAIIPVHLFGQCAEMNEIKQIAGAARGIPIIEDSCQAIGAEYHGVRTGSLGAAACFSFYPTKNLGGFGDGGLITTDDAELAATLRVLRDHGQQPRYYHHFVGLNSRLDALQAAVLSVKLPHLDSWAAARKRHAERYATEFTRRGIGAMVVAPAVVDGCKHVWNQYTVRVTNGRRDALQKHLGDRKIGAAIYYPVPLHLQKCFSALGYEEGSLPVTEQACREVLSLPVYPELTAPEQDAVINAIAEFCQEKSRAAA